jgi:hypothetical protein
VLVPICSILLLIYQLCSSLYHVCFSFSHYLFHLCFSFFGWWSKN